MKNKKSTMKKSILEIVPIREITENGYFRMDDGKVMELLQIQTIGAYDAVDERASIGG